jgi:NAD(P)-dependent dehydrogenase (short-subunit alcohol dehydrogenase family)
MPRDYIDKVAVITGAGSGLGRALATELVQRSCRIVLIDVDAGTLALVAAALSKPGVPVTQHCADVESEDAMNRVAAAILETHGRVDLLINNAGISVSSPFLRTNSAAFERVMRVNFFGVVNSCRAFLSISGLREGAQIMNVASSFARFGYPGKTAYAASKAAVRAFSECLRLECATANIGVTLLYPGPLAKNLVSSGMADSEERRAREMEFLKVRGLPLEVVARRSIDALGRNPCRIVIGSDYHLLDAMVRISPGLASWLIRKMATRAGF